MSLAPRRALLLFAIAAAFAGAVLAAACTASGPTTPTTVADASDAAPAHYPPPCDKDVCLYDPTNLGCYVPESVNVATYNGNCLKNRDAAVAGCPEGFTCYCWGVPPPTHGGGGSFSLAADCR